MNLDSTSDVEDSTDIMDVNLSFLDSSNETFYSASSENFCDRLEEDGNFTINNITSPDVLNTCSEIHSNSVGTDGISIKFIQILSPIISPFLTFLINSCLTKSIFLGKWKYARIVATFKVKIPKDPSDFRPIS
jgi:hypothetical protein